MACERMVCAQTINTHGKRYLVKVPLVKVPVVKVPASETARTVLVDQDCPGKFDVTLAVPCGQHVLKFVEADRLNRKKAEADSNDDGDDSVSDRSQDKSPPAAKKRKASEDFSPTVFRLTPSPSRAARDGPDVRGMHHCIFLRPSTMSCT